MTDTLTSERGLARVRLLAKARLPGALRYGVEQTSESTRGIQDWPEARFLKHSRTRLWEETSSRLAEYAVVFEPEELPFSSYTWTIRYPERKEFEGLAAILASLQEPARNQWSPLFLVSDEEWPVPATSDTFLSYLREAFVGTCVRWQLQEWVERARELAREILPADVEPARKVTDPENEAEWWIAIAVKCHGSVESILGAYDKLVKRFVAEVPPEARDRIRFEVQVEG